MSIEPSGNAKDIFLAAIQIESADDREAYLSDACNDDTSLRHRVDALILAHEKPESLLNDAAPRLDSGVSPTVDYPVLEQPGMQIGQFTLRERIGAGGMGVVWAAERKEPIHQRVAIKVIKPGMDSEQVLARFQAEKNVLALMDHPNVAKVLDAGTTDQGRPYFVMELIRGIPITEYCDSHKLDLRKRIEIVLQICKAVQHAHQKGIIHRDIKPSNILVGEKDGDPVVKVIDFGVAKALHGSDADVSIYSGLFQAIGTLAYMSPEQAGLCVDDIDTRADVYCLGVLLYELVTGATPFDKEQLEKAAINEAFRVIRETEPPKPSTRVSSLDGRLAEASRVRGTELKNLHRDLRGDLDTVIMKAMSKDRTQRYESPSSLASDLRRYLDH